MLHTMEEEQALKTENKMMWLTECFAGSLVLTFDASSVQAHPCAKSYVFQRSQTKNKVSLEVKPEKMCKYFHLHASFGGPISICGKKVSRKLTILNGMWLLVLFLFTLDICGGGERKTFLPWIWVPLGHSHVDRTDQIYETNAMKKKKTRIH